MVSTSSDSPGPSKPTSTRASNSSSRCADTPASSAAHAGTDGSAKPAGASAPGTSSHSSSTRSTWSNASLSPDTA
jgi:hypothetical protein